MFSGSGTTLPCLTSISCYDHTPFCSVFVRHLTASTTQCIAAIVLFDRRPCFCPILSVFGYFDTFVTVAAVLLIRFVCHTSPIYLPETSICSSYYHSTRLSISIIIIPLLLHTPVFIVLLHYFPLYCYYIYVKLPSCYYILYLYY